MKRAGLALTGTVMAAVMLATALVFVPGTTDPAAAKGVGGASWTPSESTTTAELSRFLISGDSFTYRNDAVWSRAQTQGLAGYLANGLRYTHEVNDRSGRLSATGYWATNLPDPAFDRDDDDGDGRWEEAEIIGGAQVPESGETYTSMVQFSRWHAKRIRGSCEWAWDRRLGTTEVLSQLSRDLLGEWQAERYTLTYDKLPYPRVGGRPDVPANVPRARCSDARPGTNQDGFVITFAEPLTWSELTDLVTVGSGKWTAFEAVGSGSRDDLTWTCGGPVLDTLKLGPCRGMGVRPDGVSAAVGYFDDYALEHLRAHARVAHVEVLRDSLTGLLFDVGGFGIERPGLTVNDRYWEGLESD